MQRGVGHGDADHRAGELAELAVLVREGGGVELRTDLGPGLAIVTPLEPGAASADVQTHADWSVVHGRAGVEHLGLLAVLQTHD